MGVLLLRRWRPIGEPSDAKQTAWPFATTLDGTRGAGRITVALLELGVGLDRLRQAVIDPDVLPAELDGFDLGERFETVVLGSHLVNLPSDDVRRSFLHAAARHAAPGSRVLLEHHPVDWAETAEPTPPTPGATVGMEEVHRDPPFVSAVSTYDIGGHYLRVPFTARVLSETELTSELAGVGLSEPQRISPTWLAATG